MIMMAFTLLKVESFSVMGQIILLALFLLVETGGMSTEVIKLNSSRTNVQGPNQLIANHDSRATKTETAEDIRITGSAILSVLRSDNPKNPNVDIKLGPLAQFDQKAFDMSLIRAMNRRRDNSKKEPRRQRGHCGSDKVCRRIRRLQRKRNQKRRENQKTLSRMSFDAFLRLQNNENSEKKTIGEKAPKKNNSFKKGNKPQIVSSDEILKSNKHPLVITKASQLKRDWCRTDQLKQKIREPGCRSKTIINNFCYGQCNSFFIPLAGSEVDASNNTKNTFQSCAFCKPYKTAWINVTLRCPGLVPPNRTKRVLRVQKCRCQAEIVR